LRNPGLLITDLGFPGFAVAQPRLHAKTPRVAGALNITAARWVCYIAAAMWKAYFVAVTDGVISNSKEWRHEQRTRQQERNQEETGQDPDGKTGREEIQERQVKSGQAW